MSVTNQSLHRDLKANQGFLILIFKLRNTVINMNFNTLSIARLSLTLLIAGTLFAALPARAQEKKTWSLEDCINHARQNNLNVRKQMLNIRIAQADLLSSKASLLPSINGSANHVYNWGQTIDMYTNQFATERVQSNNFYIQGSVTIFDGFQKMNQIRNNQLNLQVSKLNVEKTMNDISLNVVTFYLQTLFYIELEKTTKEQWEVTKQQVEKIRRMVEAGTMAQGELFNTESQAATEELAWIEARNNLGISYLTLSQLLDLNNMPDFTIEIPEISRINLTENVPGPKEVYDYAIENQPDIKASKLNLAIANRSLSIARGQHSPTLSLGGSWGTGYSGAAKEGFNPKDVLVPIGETAIGKETVLGYGTSYEYRTKSFSDQIRANENKSLGLYLNVPILNGLLTRTAISKAKINVENANLDLEIQSNNLNKLIQQAHADALAALQKFTASQKKLTAANESFHYAEKKFNVGMLTSIEYNENKKNLSKAESDLLQARFDYIFKTKILDFYLGKELTLKN